MPRINELLVAYLNSLEAFAIPFAAGVADDDLGFRETAMAFCQSARIFMPAFFQMRGTGAARFESSVQLLDRWNKRLIANVAAPLMKTLEELIKSVAKDKIKPIVT